MEVTKEDLLEANVPLVKFLQSGLVESSDLNFKLGRLWREIRGHLIAFNEDLEALREAYKPTEGRSSSDQAAAFETARKNLLAETVTLTKIPKIYQRDIKDGQGVTAWDFGALYWLIEENPPKVDPANNGHLDQAIEAKASA
jgi:hypothetical protein